MAFLFWEERFSANALDGSGYPCVIREVMPGKGVVDFKKVVRLCEKLGKDTTVFVEHLDTHEEYIQAADYVRSIAEQEGIVVIGS